MISRLRFILLIALTVFIVPGAWGEPQQMPKITLNYPTRTGQSWALYIAKEGGYYQKYALDANIVFGASPTGIAMVISAEAAMTVSTLAQSMQAGSKAGAPVSVARL